MESSPELNRTQFLRLFGAGAVALLASACVGGCTYQHGDPTPVPAAGAGPLGVDFTLDLLDPANAFLDDPRTGFVYNANRTIIVAKTTTNLYIALQAPCPHAATPVYFSRSQDLFACPSHGSIFRADGSLVSGSGPAATGLTKYSVAQTGHLLRITG